MDPIKNGEGFVDKSAVHQVASKIADSVLESAMKIITDSLGEENANPRTLANVIALAMVRSLQRCWK